MYGTRHLQGETRHHLLHVGVRFALSGLIFQIMTVVLYIIPYITPLYPNSLGCALSSKYILFVAEEGVDIKTGRETDVAALSSSFLIEGAGRENLSPPGLH